MTEPSARLKQALAQVQAPWDAARTERTQQTLTARQGRQQRRRLLGSGLALFAAIGVAVIGAVMWRLDGTTHEPTASAAVTTTAVIEAQPAASSPASLGARPASQSSLARPRARFDQLQFSDGSSVELLEPDTRISLEQDSERLVVARLAGGGARFRVTPRPDRTFRVHTQRVVVEVLGTLFKLEPRGSQTWVQVEHGRVAVSWEGQRRELRDGEGGLFPPDVVATEDQAAGEASVLLAGETARFDAAASTRAAAPSTRGRAARVENANSWRDHAERGDFKRAFPLLPAADTTRGMGVAELLLAADAARLSGHPRAALPFLERVVEAHPDDARAPLAAFTLGGVLMNQLGLPREAEAAYRKARNNTHSTALAQDALARQVEAAHRAGDDALARELSREYLERYPEGRRLHAVRRFGGL